jgi:hypothetical protein
MSIIAWDITQELSSVHVDLLHAMPIFKIFPQILKRFIAVLFDVVRGFVVGHVFWIQIVAG